MESREDGCKDRSREKDKRAHTASLSLPSFLRQPLPPSAEGFPLYCNPYDDETPTAWLEDGSLTSLASFALPLDSLDLFIRGSTEVAIWSLVVEPQGDDEERDWEHALVEVVATYDEVGKRDAVQCCLMVPPSGMGEAGTAAFVGIGLYVSRALSPSRLVTSLLIFVVSSFAGPEEHRRLDACSFQRDGPTPSSSTRPVLPSTKSRRV